MTEMLLQKTTESKEAVHEPQSTSFVFFASLQPILIFDSHSLLTSLPDRPYLEKIVVAVRVLNLQRRRELRTYHLCV